MSVPPWGISLGFWGGGAFFQPYGGKIGILKFFAPPYFGGQGGQNGFLPPHISEARGGKTGFCPPKWGENPAAGGKFSGFDPPYGGKFSGFDPLKYWISFTKMYLVILNPKKIPPAAGLSVAIWNREFLFEYFQKNVWNFYLKISKKKSANFLFGIFKKNVSIFFWRFSKKSAKKLEKTVFCPPPRISGPRGGNFFAPPYFGGQGGQLKNHCPPIWGGKKQPLASSMRYRHSIFIFRCTPIFFA